MSKITTAAKYLFYLGALGAVGNLVMYGTARPASVTFAALLCLPYIGLQIRAGQTDGRSRQSQG